MDGSVWSQEGKLWNVTNVENTQMRLTNLEFDKYADMTEKKERKDYADARLYIHKRNKG